MYNFSFENLVKKYFKYFQENFGCSVAKSTQTEVILQSKIFQIRLLLDRYYVQVFLGPTSHITEWYDLRTITAYLNQETDENEWDYELPRGVTATKAVEMQLERLANILTDHIQQIVPLFRESIYCHIGTELTEFGRERRKRRFAELKKKYHGKE